ncbi:universal stress protein [Flavisericum labens]|uniref:universal stress protein n=1 Tax=Flavisericum labens TaxID=3377112 RepID=UPI00387B5EDF
MKRVLLPTDFSRNSINAIHYALDLLKKESCQFYVLNVQKASSFISDDMMVVNSSATIYKTLIDAAKKSIQNIIVGVKKEFDNERHEFHPIIDYDNFIDSINQVCETRNIDLIIMGTKGASGLDKVIFGSNTVRVMQRCVAPVLAVPNDYKFNGLGSVAFMTKNITFTDNSDLKALADLLHGDSLKLKVLHVSDVQNKVIEQNLNMEFFKTHFPEAKHKFIKFEGADVFGAVHNYIEDDGVELLAMMSKKHSFLERLFTRHTVETFAFKIDVPFLVMHKNS